MSKAPRPSPRQEAFFAILESSATSEDTIPDSAWDKLVTIAWDNRSHVGDRRDIQRQIRATLLDASRDGGDDSAAH